MTDLIPLIESRAWYPLVAILLTYALRLWSRFGPSVASLPSRWQWLPPVAVAAVGGFVDAQANGEAWLSALGLAVYAGLSVGLSAIGWHHTEKRLTP